MRRAAGKQTPRSLISLAWHGSVGRRGHRRGISSSRARQLRGVKAGLRPSGNRQRRKQSTCLRETAGPELSPALHPSLLDRSSMERSPAPGPLWPSEPSQLWPHPAHLLGRLQTALGVFCWGVLHPRGCKRSLLGELRGNWGGRGGNTGQDTGVPSSLTELNRFWQAFGTGFAPSAARTPAQPAALPAQPSGLRFGQHAAEMQLFQGFWGCPWELAWQPSPCRSTGRERRDGAMC